MNTKKREQWIDNAKGLAIICIIIGHTSSGINDLIDFSFVNGFHLVVFLILSGYTFSKKELNRVYISKKFDRMMRPYFLTCLAVMIMDIWNSFYLEHNISTSRITDIFTTDCIRSFYASGSNTNYMGVETGTRIGAIWFLPALFFSLLFFQLIVQFTEKTWILGITTGMFMVFSWMLSRVVWLPFSVQSSLFSLFFLWIGFEMKKKCLIMRLSWQHYLIAFLVSITGIYMGYSNIGFVMATANDIVISTIVGIAEAIVVFGISLKIKKNNILAYIGKNSLIVLCVHLFAIETMGWYFNTLIYHIGIRSKIKVGCLFLILNIVFAIGMMFLINKFIVPMVTMMKDNICKKDTQFNVQGQDKEVLIINVMLGILICMLLLGENRGGSLFEQLMQSCGITGIVLMCGYRSTIYDKRKSIRYIILLLSAYFLCAIGSGLMHPACMSKDAFRYTITRYCLGSMSSSSSLSGVSSVGIAGLLLVLIIIYIIYNGIKTVLKNENLIVFFTLILSILGYLLGNNNVFMIWNIDSALFLLVFYVIGVIIKRFEIFKYCENNRSLYFVFISVYAFFIYNGGVNISERKYGGYGLAILGTLGGTFLIFQLAMYMIEKSIYIRKVFEMCGQAGITILVVHIVFQGYIERETSKVFYPSNIPFLIISVGIQITISILFLCGYQLLKKRN